MDPKELSNHLQSVDSLEKKKKKRKKKRQIVF